MRETKSAFSLLHFVLFAVGLLLFIFGFFLMINVSYAASLTSTNVEPASLIAGAQSTVTVSFTTATNLPNNGKIKVTFPSGFNISSLTPPINCTGFNGGITFLSLGQTITITRNGAGATLLAPATISCTFPTITNPTVAGPTGTYTILTTDSSDVTLDSDSAVSSDTIVAATLTSTNVRPVSLRTRTSNTVIITFTTVNTLANSDKIKITFPLGFDVSGATGGACSTMDGSFATSVSGQNVIITRSGGSGESAGAQECLVSGIINPTNIGSGGTYSLATLNNLDATRDLDSAVAANIFTSSSDDRFDAPLTYALFISSPRTGDVFEPADPITLSWISGGTGNIGYVDIFSSFDGGITWDSIALNERNKGSYSWRAPDVSSDDVILRIEGTDLATVLAAGKSGTFTIQPSSQDGEASDEPDVEDDEVEEDVEEIVDGSEDDSSEDFLPVGTYIRGGSEATIYLVDEGGVRRPFLDEQTYFTYEDDFDDMVVLEDEELSLYLIGSPMLPKVNVVLVKISSVDRVYALVEEDGVSTLRWITSESLVEEIYGNSWDDYVIDIPVTAWGYFEIGEDIESSADIWVDVNDMLTREEVNGH